MQSLKQMRVPGSNPRFLPIQNYMDDYYATREWPKGSAGNLRRAPLLSWQRSEPFAFERLEFLGSFLRRPATVGAVCPSSPALAREVVKGCNLEDADTVVELGPGTGAITRFILEAIGEETLFMALELEDRHVRGLRHRFPGVRVYHDTAERLPHYLAQHGRSGADYVLSGLPWGNMSGKLQHRILEAVLTALRPGGVFATIAYAHAGWYPAYRHFRKWLKLHFAEVSVSPVVWFNVPPAVVYRCRRAGAHDPAPR